jgi:multidrug efflux pump subunit AcrB
MRNISAWSIKNPVPPIVLFVALSLAGLVSFLRMDINNNPDVSFPAARVIVAQPGAAPSELKTQVTQIVEAAVRNVNGVDEITSYISEGQSATHVQFDIGTPIDRAVNDVRDAIANVRSDLPEAVLEPEVIREDFDGVLAYWAVESVDMTLEELSWFVDNTLSKRLLAVPGMAVASRGGGVSREMRVELDPLKLQAQGVTAAQVNAQLRQLNLNATGGRAEIGGAEQSVRVLGNAVDAIELGATQINVGSGRTIRLADIATVRDSYGEQRGFAMMDGRQVVGVRLQKSKGSSDVTVYEDALKAKAEVEKEYPKVRITPMFSTVDYTQEQYESSMAALVEGAVLAVIVVFFFLRDWRAMLISATAIPLSAIPAFWFMDLMGFTLNSLSLLALSLVAGVLVDDAIVEIENIVRHMRMGKTAYQAAMDAADEIGLAVVATTAAIVAVFLPVGLMSGVVGQFFKQFGLTVVVAVAMSLAVARMVTPLIAAYFLKAHGEQNHGDGPLMDRYLNLLKWSLDTSRAHTYAATGGLRRKFVSGFLDHRVWVMGIGAVAFLLTIVAYATLPFTFQPETDDKFVQLNISMVPGTTLDQTQAVADQAEAILARQPETKRTYVDIEGPGTAVLYTNLKDDRERTSIEFMRQLSPEMQKIADARVSFQSNANWGGGREVTVMIAGDKPELLEATARKIVEEMRAEKMFVAPRVEGDLQRPEITIKPNFELAADLGITTAALSQTIRIATIGDIDQNVAKFSLSDRQIPIRVVIPEESRKSIATIENLPVPTANGGSVPLKVVANVGFGEGPSVLRRYNQRDRIVIGADLAEGFVSGEGLKRALELPTMSNLPQGVEKVEFGQSKMQNEMITQFSIAVVSGVMLVFAVLVLLYKRVVAPFVNMGSLLLAPLGGAVALHLTGQVVSMPVLIGLLMLLGIVAKNSILLIDFAVIEMEKGVDKDSAILDAGHKRAQPIVMTTVAMVAGMLPTALALTGDGAWRAPMGITVIGGLIMSTALTLVIVPAAFSLADSFEKWLAPKFGRFLTHKAPVPQSGGIATPAE